MVGVLVNNLNMMQKSHGLCVILSSEAPAKHRKLNPAELSCIGIHKTCTHTSDIDQEREGRKRQYFSLGHRRDQCPFSDQPPALFLSLPSTWRLRGLKADGGGKGVPGGVEFENRESLWMVRKLETSDGGEW